jgi:hypothetical protein
MKVRLKKNVLFEPGYYISERELDFQELPYDSGKMMKNDLLHTFSLKQSLEN